jgi:sortase A
MARRWERIFWIVAAVGLGIYVFSVGERWLYQSYLTWEFAEMVKPPAVLGKGSPSRPGRGWRREAQARQGEASREAPFGHPLPEGEGPRLQPSSRLRLAGHAVIGRLEIPSIHLSAMISEGTDDATLRRSVGHLPGTALPGLSGNVALSAHRDTFFRNLRELHKNDLISITTVDGTFEYAIESMMIVEPDQRSVLRDVGYPTLTLITCYPFYYVGAAPKRFVIEAALITE